MLTAPVLSMLDPVAESEGSVDPLTFQPVYDRLADRILPAITVRMRRIRFVTAICAAARVCDQYAPDEVASDGVTPPWLVFEWFVVEALVREWDRDEPMRIPGGLKVSTALRANRPVSDRSYLRTPTVFGYTGIFRRFVTRLRVLTDDLALDDGGHELLSAWEVDSGLKGFLAGDAATTPGGRFRETMRKAVRDGMERGSTVKREGAFWQQLSEAFDPSEIGAGEATSLAGLLAASTSKDHARELAAALVAHGKAVERDREPDFLRRVAAKATPELADALRAIDAYESLCRPMTDAFALIRHLATIADKPIRRDDLAKDKRSALVAEQLCVGARRVLDDPNLTRWETSVAPWATAMSEVDGAAAMFDTILTHHSAAQAAKPPDGKRDWVERTHKDAVVVRHAYAIDELPDEPEYVHQYRVPTFSQFLAEVGSL